jgi:hypothetical protein
MPMRNFLTMMCLVIVSLAMNACGGSSGPKKYKVTGTVSFDGKPISEGRITFKGDASKLGTYSAPIANGSYTVEAEPGSYLVEITASRMTGKFVTTIEGKNEIGEMYIPEKYNAKSTLQKDVSSSVTEINFDLTK